MGKFRASFIILLSAGLALAEVKDMIVPILADGRLDTVSWSATTVDPGDSWFAPEFDEGAWVMASGGFGTISDPNRNPSAWSSQDIWIKKRFNIASADFKSLVFDLNMDDSYEVFLNGVPVLSSPAWTSGYKSFPVPNTLKAGENVVAIHCRNDGGGQFADAGLGGVKSIESKVLVADSRYLGEEWRYTTDVPDAAWTSPDFDVTAWNIGRAGFGTPDYGTSAVTPWSTPEIWMRRTVLIDDLTPYYLVSLKNDDDVQVFINGKRIWADGFLDQFKDRTFTYKQANLKAGENVIAVHCINTIGSAFLDLGLVSMAEVPETVAVSGRGGIIRSAKSGSNGSAGKGQFFTADGRSLKTGLRRPFMAALPITKR